MSKILKVFFGTFGNKILYRALRALGISAFVFIGANELMDLLIGRITNASNGVGSDVIGLLALGNIDVLISLVLSAHLAVFSIRRTQKFLGLS